MEYTPGLDPQVTAVLEKLEKRIGYTFNDKNMLLAALTHASGAEHRLASNERLEFLGDAILGAVVCEMLYRQYPDYLEGDLTKIKSIVVSRQTCTKISQVLGMQEFLILGKGMTTHPSVPPSLLANVFDFDDRGNDLMRGGPKRLGKALSLGRAIIFFRTHRLAIPGGCRGKSRDK